MSGTLPHRRGPRSGPGDFCGPRARVLRRRSIVVIFRERLRRPHRDRHFPLHDRTGPSSAADRSGRRHRTDCVCGPGRGYSRLSTRCVAQQLDVVGRPGWRPTGTVSDRDGVRPSGWVRAPLRRVRTGLRPVGYVGLRVRDLDEPHRDHGSDPAGPVRRLDGLLSGHGRQRVRRHVRRVRTRGFPRGHLGVLRREVDFDRPPGWILLSAPARRRLPRLRRCHRVVSFVRGERELPREDLAERFVVVLGRSLVSVATLR